MPRLNLTVEGQTEQTFAVRLLIPHLGRHGVALAKPRLTAIARKKAHVHRGGLARYVPFRNDIVCWLKQDRGSDVYFTMMLDLYGLPRDFPAYDEASKLVDAYARVAKLEEALAAEIGDPRFIPYIQLHEFEALLLSDPRAFVQYYPYHDRASASLVELVGRFQNPELIDDGENSAPSKRIRQHIQEYGPKAKRTAGPIIAAHIGLESIRAKCRHFNDWLTKLERLGSR
jgi:hypothetical protein